MNILTAREKVVVFFAKTPGKSREKLCRVIEKTLSLAGEHDTHKSECIAVASLISNLKFDEYINANTAEIKTRKENSDN